MSVMKGPRIAPPNSIHFELTVRTSKGLTNNRREKERERGCERDIISREGEREREREWLLSFHPLLPLRVILLLPT